MHHSRRDKALKRKFLVLDGTKSVRARSCISPARSAPEAGTLKALPCGALFLCLAELLRVSASRSADEGFSSIPLDRDGAVGAGSTDALLSLGPVAL